MDLLQVWFPRVDGDTQPRVTLFTPQLATVKHDRIEPLWLFPQPLRIGVREYMYAMYALAGNLSSATRTSWWARLPIEWPILAGVVFRSCAVLYIWE